RPRYCATDRRLYADALAGEPAADLDGNVRTNLLRRSHCARTAISLQQSASGIFDVAATRTPSVARISTLLAATVYLDGFEYVVRFTSKSFHSHRGFSPVIRHQRRCNRWDEFWRLLSGLSRCCRCCCLSAENGGFQPRFPSMLQRSIGSFSSR